MLSPTTNDAEALALSAMAATLTDERRARRFLDLTGLEVATGEYVIIQDADLEYDPRDYVAMMRAILDRRADIVYQGE